MSDVTARPLQVTARMPTREDADAIGAKKPQYVEKAPYVREKLTGMIHHWQDWMYNMGDVLEPCWEAPPVPGIVVANNPIDIAHFAEPSPPPKPATSHKAETTAPSVLLAPKPRKPHRSRAQLEAKSRAHAARGDGNAG